MRLGQVILCNKRNTFFKNYVEISAGRLAPDYFLFFKKASYDVKASGV